MSASSSTSGERDRDPRLEAAATLGATDRVSTTAGAVSGTGRDRVEPTLVSSNAGPGSMPSEGIGGARARLMAELLAQGLTVRLVAAGHSMSPFIRSGDTLEIEPLASAARFGDVVAVATEGRLLIHRVVSFRGHPLRIRGDVAPHDDPSVSSYRHPRSGRSRRARRASGPLRPGPRTSRCRVGVANGRSARPRQATGTTSPGLSKAVISSTHVWRSRPPRENLRLLRCENEPAIDQRGSRPRRRTA